jgi:arsenate reductase (thioredoxin)
VQLIQVYVTTEVTLLHKPRVLFFSTGDSTRSQMAEGFLRAFAGDKLIGVSTAVRTPERNPLTVEVMNEVGVDISEQHAEALPESLKEHFAYVITLCDASRERFPVWPFTRNLFHWSLPDPTVASGSTEERKTAFRRVRDEIRQKVREFTSQKVPGLMVRGAAAGMKS